MVQAGHKLLPQPSTPHRPPKLPDKPILNPYGKLKAKNSQSTLRSERWVLCCQVGGLRVQHGQGGWSPAMNKSCAYASMATGGSGFYSSLCLFLPLWVLE